MPDTAGKALDDIVSGNYCTGGVCRERKSAWLVGTLRRLCGCRMTSVTKYFQVGLAAPAVARGGTMEQGGLRT